MNCSGIYFWISTKYENYNRLLKKCFIIWLTGTMAWNLLPQQEVKKELWIHRVRMTWNIFNRHFPYYITCGSSHQKQALNSWISFEQVKKVFKTNLHILFNSLGCYVYGPKLSISCLRGHLNTIVAQAKMSPFGGYRDEIVRLSTFMALTKAIGVKWTL